MSQAAKWHCVYFRLQSRGAAHVRSPVGFLIQTEDDIDAEMSRVKEH